MERKTETVERPPWRQVEETDGATRVKSNGDSMEQLGYARGSGSGGKRPFIILALVLILVAAGLGWIVYRAMALQAATAKGPRGPFSVPVVAATARQGDMGIYLTGLGTVTPLNTVAIHSRVDGQVMNVNFTEGAMVKQGDVLAQLDARPFQVQLEQAQGQLLKDQAQLKDAQLDLQRYKSAPGSFTQQQIDTQQAVVDQAAGAVRTDQGAIDSANLNIDYCRITAPLTGKIGFRLIDPGNIVHAADTTPIAVITQFQPITVVFNLPEDNLQQVLVAASKGKVLAADAYNRDATTKISSGALAAIDNQVDSTTGTVRFKATFPNTDNLLYPSQFVNARLLVDVRKNVVIVPSAAVQRSPTSTFVYVVKSDNTVDMREVTIGPTEGDDTLIARGLSAGEIVVTDGVDKLIAGAKVSIDKMLAAPGVPTTAPAAGSPQGHGRPHANAGDSQQ